MKTLQFLLRLLTIGRSPQSFIGAPWIPLLLKVIPQSKRRWMALRIVGLSPHYFYRHANRRSSHLSEDKFLEAEYARNEQSRMMIYEIILKHFLTRTDRVLDYGCGPGFLARIVSKSVSKVYAVDISCGALECAKIINASHNVEYILLDQAQAIPSSSLDVIYSFAVIQHITDDAFEQALIMCSEKLKPGGRIIFQVQLSDPQWRTEKEWRADRSFASKVKFRYGLHHFSRPPDYFFTTMVKFGFQPISLTPIEDMCTTRFDDICSQHLLLAKSTKAAC